MRRFVLVSTAILFAVWLILTSALGIVAAEMAFHPGRRTLTIQAVAIAQSMAARNHATFADASIVAADGVTLRAWHIRPQTGNGAVVILLHGHTDNRAGMLGFADMFLRHGYSVLLPDARAHGSSGGEIATYGVKERDDIRLWFNWLQMADSPHCIYALGESMGAAQLLQSLSVEPNFCAVVAESSFASFREASYDRLGERLHAGSWLGRTLLRPAVESGLLYARWRYGIDFNSASPQVSVAFTTVPVFLIHGLKDTNLPARNSELIVAASHSRVPPVVLWEPAAAGHTGASAAEPDTFQQRVLGWFQSHSHL